MIVLRCVTVVTPPLLEDVSECVVVTPGPTSLRLENTSDEELNALRARALSYQPLLLAAIGELLEQPHAAAFEFGLDLLIDGLRARFAP